eukprot:TRINITY_DN15987_c0_g1_i5.p1 TRINITY_DN15987_c0_g1~~TRINITY_DN15987_c0_g1_i5.p1  ORF type:complete len:160 (+),score=40.53 TRINITY_DN15987_c0_g1_i5:110-589(+)
MIRRPPRSTQGVSSAASDVYKRQVHGNPDEFYMKMTKSRLVDGKLIVEEEKKGKKNRIVNQETKLALVSMKHAITEKNAEKQSAQLHLIGFPKVNSHIHFIDDVRELADERPEAAPETEIANLPEVEEISDMAQNKKKPISVSRTNSEKKRPTPGCSAQ